MHSGHPLMVHLPLVALPLAVLVDAVAIWTQDRRWRPMATVLWGLGLVGAAAAVATGLIAYSRVEHSEAGHQVMTLHRNVALGAVALILLSGVARWRWPLSRPAVLLGTLGVAGLVGAGYLGGEVVFRHAIGLPTRVLEQVMMERGGHAHGDQPDESPARPAVDSGSPKAAVDSTAPHRHDHPQSVPHSQ